MAEIFTAHQIREMLAEKIDGISKLEMSNIGLEVFPRLMSVLSKQQDCQKCQYYFDELMVYVRDVTLIFKGSKEEQKRFHHLTSEAIDFLKKDKDIRPKGQIKTLWSFAGSVMGLIVGWNVMPLFFPHIDAMRGALLGWIVFLIPFWLIGRRIEKKSAKKGLLF